METTQRTEEDVCCALYECDNDLDRAVIFLFESLPVVSFHLVLFDCRGNLIQVDSINVVFVSNRAHSRLRLKRRRIGWLALTMQRLEMVNGMRTTMPAVRITMRTTTVTFAKSLAIVAAAHVADAAIPIAVAGEAENLGRMNATPVTIGPVINGRVQMPAHVAIHQVHSVAAAAAVAEAVAMAGNERFDG